VADIMDAYDLTAAQVHAALAYYYDHRAEIDALMAADQHDVPPQAEIEQRRRVLLKRWQERTGLDPDEDLTVSQVAAEYGISPQAIREACQKGWVNARKSGSTWLLKRFGVHNRWG
jgi:uncharacterized protein (DUF433 family)